MNTASFNSVDPIVNGDIELRDLCVDIRSTVQHVVELRNGTARNYHIHFFRSFVMCIVWFFCVVDFRREIIMWWPGGSWLFYKKFLNKPFITVL